MTLPCYALYTDGPSYAPNSRYIVEVRSIEPDLPLNRFRCYNIQTKKEFICNGNQLKFDDLPK